MRTFTHSPYADSIDASLSASEGQITDALQKFRAFLQNHIGMRLIDPELYSDAQERLGLLLYQTRRFADAIDPLEQALALAKDDAIRRRLCYYIGSSKFESGDFKTAEHRFAES